MNRYTIIIPVHNAFDLAKRCIESVLRNTSREHSILLMDDGSTDERVLSLFDLLDQWPPAKRMCIMNSTAQGFVKSVNHCLEVSEGDVIILNSDTEVPPNWVDRLDAARNAHPNVAAVCPLSNYATIYSVPNAGNNDLPAYLTVEQMDRLVEETSFVRRPIVPVVMGFCMLLTRAAIDAVGLLDEAFGLGYGEEVDLCLRARAAGFVSVLADDLYVWHKGKASFGTGDVAMREGAQGENLVRERYPEYITEIQNWYFTSTATRAQDTHCRPSEAAHEQDEVESAPRLHRHSTQWAGPRFMSGVWSRPWRPTLSQRSFTR